MKFTINSATEILARTPPLLNAFLSDLDIQWTNANEGIDTWSPFDVLGHLIHCDKYAWLPRIKIALSENQIRRFEPIDRFAQINLNKGKSMNELLKEFIEIRQNSLKNLLHLNLSEDQLNKTAIHPDLGTVTLAQLISTWVAHDLDHLSQIARVLAKQYKDEVGPWKDYMKILKEH